MKLAEHFKSPHYSQALERYTEIAAQRGWSVGHKLEMYGYAKRAFNPVLSEMERRTAFHSIYENLRRGWRVFRNARTYWSADQVFDALIHSCQLSARTGGMDLTALASSPTMRAGLLHCLGQLSDLKEIREYPHMAVSKFTHFFNPRLFPIYDNELIWKQVCCSCFKADYQDLCARTGIQFYETTVSFNVSYTVWASEMIQSADPSFMPDFAEWFGEQVAGQPDPENVLSEIHQYYSTAFEFVALGAAAL